MENGELAGAGRQFSVFSRQPLQPFTLYPSKIFFISQKYFPYLYCHLFPVYAKRIIDNTNIPVLLGRLPEHDYRQNPLADYPYQVIRDVCHLKSIFLSQLSGKI
jgi:hypothetical protein